MLAKFIIQGTSTKLMGNFFSKTFNRDIAARPCIFNRCGCIYEGVHYSTEQKSKNYAILRELMRESPGIVRKITPSRLYWFIKRRFLK